MMYDEYAKQFLKNINDCIDEKIKEVVKIKTTNLL